MSCTTYEEATIALTQHRQPCHDCPWRREAVRGWLGATSKQNWLSAVHGESYIECHAVRGTKKVRHQCAGAAIYRANVGKVPRNPAVLTLPADKEAVFSNPAEFLKHHTL